MSEHDLIDATVRNQIALRRYLARENREMQKLFEEYDRKVAALLRKKYRENMTMGSPSLKALYAEIKDLRTQLMIETNKRARSMSQELAPVEGDKEWALLLLLLGASGKKPGNPSVSSILNTPFAAGALSAATYAQWFAKLRAADQIRIRDVLSRSVTESVPTNEVVKRVVGSKANGFKDGALARSRQNVAAMLTTLATHISNTVRMHIWKKTPSVRGAVWVAILDRRTTAICRSRDNKVIMFGGAKAPKGATLLSPQSARPPAHVNCRSTLAPLRVGAVPKRRTYSQWLLGQSRSVQEDILGKAKSEMFRSGKVSLDQFVDSSGKEFTIKQLLSAA
jgi:SPP1 gp7 family putative phage head morphogenesis protein